MQIVVINGYPTSGKSQFVKYCKEILGIYCLEKSTIDGVKRIARMIGWDGEKTPKTRKFLSDIKDLLTEYNNFPYNDVMRDITSYEKQLKEIYPLSYDNLIVFIHCREPKEIQKFVDNCNAKTLFINRPQVKNKQQSNHADECVEKFNYDYIIMNDGTLDDLMQRAKEFINMLRKEN